MNNLVKIENNNIIVANEIIEQFKNFKKQKEEMELKEKEFKQALKDAMEECNIKKFCINGLSATYKEGTCRVTLDTKKLKEDLPDIYEEYSKTSEVASSITLTIAD